MLTREGKFAILFYNCKGVFYEKIYLISKSFLIFFIRNLIYTQVFRDTIVRFSVNIYIFCKIIPSDFSFQGIPIAYIFLFYIISSVSFVKLISFCTGTNASSCCCFYSTATLSPAGCCFWKRLQLVDNNVKNITTCFIS